MNTPSVFSILFIAACAVSIFLGIYSLYLNARSKTNILFFLLTISLDIWAFGFSMAVSAENLSLVLFWRRFSAIGWGIFFSFLLHFFIVLTGREKVKRKWAYLLLYVPSLISYLGFTFIPEINPEQYNMVFTQMGWINIAANNVWDWFYMAYYIIFSAAGFYVVWRWGRKSSNSKVKKQSLIIVFSFILTMVIGSVTDILGFTIFGMYIPQLAPLLMVLPSLVVYYSIKKYGMLNPKHTDEDYSLMSDQIRAKIVNYMSNAFLFGGVLNIISQYFLYENGDLISVLAFSIALILIGVLLQAIQRNNMNKNLKDILSALVFSLAVPVLTLRFIDFAGVTVWAFPFILLIITLVFGQRYVLLTLSISMIMTQIVVWLIKPEVYMKIDGVDYIVRIGLIMIAIWFSNFVKNVYQVRLKENARQINSQSIVMEISSDFVSLNEANMESKIGNALNRIGSFAKLNRAYIYLFDDNKENLACRYIWSDTDKYIRYDISGSDYPLVMSSIKRGEPVASSDVADIDNEMNAELLRLLGSGGRSFAAMPVICNNIIYGFLGIDSEPKKKPWNDSQLDFFKILSNILADAFEKVEHEKEITQLAFYDNLTNLPNRVLFKDRADQAICLAERTGKLLAVVFLDLDAFKAVNDAVGHESGDSLIKKVSEKLAKTIRKSDAVSRFGGDEFLILLNNINFPDDIKIVVNKILDMFETPFVINGQEFYVTASAGIAVYPYDGKDSSMLIKNADIAMYKAKEQGRNQYLFCTTDMKDEVVQKMMLRNSLYRALDRHEFILHYQPQVDTKTKRIVGAEALIRWNNPKYGMIPPGTFIPLAEQTGLIGPIGEWVLKTACHQCKTWQSNGLPKIRIAVNVSVLQLRNPDFVSRVEHILIDSQLEPQFLELEITESAAVNESDYFFKVLDDLKNLGILISIDDFGTEYSSLSRLTSMPVDRIKLDMQFVHNIGKSDRENAIIQGIIGLAHNLGLRVIAEGVETDWQLDFLSIRNCDEIQGFYFYRPVNSEDLEAILKKQKL